MKYSLCLSTSPARFDAVPFKGNFVENVKKIAELGFDGVELAIRDPKAIDAAGIIAQVSQFNLAVSAIGTGQAWGEEGLSFTDPDRTVREKAVDRVISHLDFAANAGAIVIIGLLRGVVRSTVKLESANAWMFEAFSECCRAAAAKGVKIAFEPINRYETSLINSVREGLAFIDKVGAPNLGMLLDTFHMNIEEPSIEESIKLARDRMFHFHYADSNRMYPGAGHIDFGAVLEAVRDTGYKGFVSGEHRPDPDSAFSAAKGLDYLKKIEKQILEENT